MQSFRYCIAGFNNMYGGTAFEDKEIGVEFGFVQVRGHYCLWHLFWPGVACEESRFH